MSEEIKDETTVGNTPDGAKKAVEPTQEQPVQPVPYDRFKEVNDAKKASETELEALRAKIADAEAKEAEEAGKFKELWEKEKAAREAAEQAQVNAKLDFYKETELSKAGYTGEKLATVKALLTGDTEEALKAQIDSFKELFPTSQYVDPSLSNGGQRPAAPTPNDAEQNAREAARKLFKRKGAR
ncbi:hypothetical protein [Listeria booriae]|uniref:Scaffolding protein n=1 Tax=Listeria booriae TaxID=1552123 RepID=A0A841ZUE0_9LIST|nr:hypothetical protein [Listeria booriae]MBC1564166.1 hypothetical protein [Listeria booriae]